MKTLASNVRVSAELFERLVNTVESLNARIGLLEIAHEQLETRTNLRDYFVPPLSNTSDSATRYTWKTIPSDYPPCPKAAMRATTFPPPGTFVFGGITSEPSSGAAAAPPPPLPLPPSPARPSLT